LPCVIIPSHSVVTIWTPIYPMALRRRMGPRLLFKW
jgi:hypothetical protein